MSQRLLLRRGTALQWALVNPVLAPGEPGLETDTSILKLGDGVHAWLDLPELVVDSRLFIPTNKVVVGTTAPVSPLPGSVWLRADANLGGSTPAPPLAPNYTGAVDFAGVGTLTLLAASRFLGTTALSGAGTLAARGPTQATNTIIGINAGGAAETVTQRLAWASGIRLARSRWYYGLNALPSTFSSTFSGGAPENSAQVSFKRLPTQITDGSYDAVLTGYLTSIPSNWRILLTYWHEPNSELSSGQFTIAQWKAAQVYINNLIHSLGLLGRVRLAPNFTAPHPETGVAWSDSWMMTPTDIPDAIWTWDGYGNPYGGQGYDAAYPPVAQVLDPLLKRTKDYGWMPAWGITEFNTPRRNFDSTEVQRTQWIQDFVNYCMAASTPPQQILLWEGNGVQFDQKFYTQTIKNKWRDLSLTSPLGNSTFSF